MNQNVNCESTLWLNAELTISFIKGKLTVAWTMWKNVGRCMNSKQPVLCTRLNWASAQCWGIQKHCWLTMKLLRNIEQKIGSPVFMTKSIFFRFKDAEKMVYAKIKIKQSLRPNVIIGEIMRHTIHWPCDPKVCTNLFLSETEEVIFVGLNQSVRNS